MDNIKTLRRLAHQANRFSVLENFVYIVPSKTSSCPPASLGLVSEAPAPTKPKRAPSDHTILNRLASSVVQFDLVYPDTRDFFRESFLSSEFLVTRTSSARQEKEKEENIASLKELNRLARIVELSGPSTCPEFYPVYTPPAYAHTRRGLYSKNFPSPFDFRLKRELKLDSTVERAFPKTTIVKPKFINGHPRFERAFFTSSLLAPKLAEARRFYKTNTTPAALPRRVTSWICSLFRFHPPSPQKKDNTKSVKPRQAKKTTDRPPIIFVPSTDEKKESSPPPSPKPTSVHLEAEPDSILSSSPPADFPDVYVNIEGIKAAHAYVSKMSLPLSYDSITLRDFASKMTRLRTRVLIDSLPNHLHFHEPLSTSFLYVYFVSARICEIDTSSLSNYASSPHYQVFNSATTFERNWNALSSSLRDLTSLF
jgi:hypothetical protein